MKNINELPSGIRRRGDKYQAIVTRHSRQYSATFKTLEEAVQWREAFTTQHEIPQPQQTQQQHMTTETKTITLEAAIQKTIETRWADTKAEKTSTLNAYIIMRFFGPRTKLTNITTQAVERLIEDQKQKGLSNATINRKLACLSVILKTAEDFGYQTGNPRFIRRKEYRGRDRFLTLEEEQKIIALLTLWNKLDQLDCFILLLDTGIRLGEALRLKVHDIDFAQGKHGIIQIWVSKNNYPRSVPLTKRVKEYLQERIERLTLSPDDPLFNHHTKSWFRTTWGRLRGGLGYDDDDQFVPHILRHTCASRLVQKGIPIAMVQKWMGHLSIQSTMRYSHLAPTALYELVD